MNRKYKFIYKLLNIALTAFVSVTAVYCSETGKAMSGLPQSIGATNVGKEFWFTIPPFTGSDDNIENSVIVYVSSSAKTAVTVEVTGKAFSSTKYTIPNDVVSFTIDPANACPWTKAPGNNSPKTTIYRQSGIHVISDDLIVVFVYVQTRGSGEYFMALPVSSLGTSYISTAYTAGSVDNSLYPSLTGCVAPYDDTKIRFIVGGNDSTITPGGLAAGDTSYLTLDRGDVCMFASDSSGFDLSGSKWLSDKPIAVVSGNYCAGIPTGNREYNYIAEMDLPVFTWGTAYQAARIEGRKYAPLIRVFAGESKTKVYRDSSVIIASLTTSGGLYGKGWKEARLFSQQSTANQALITGTKPISAALYNTGSMEDSNSVETGPFETTLISPEQYQKECSFIVPCNDSKSSFIKHFLSIIFEADSAGNVPESLELGRLRSGVFEWEKLAVTNPGTGEVFSPGYKGKTYAFKNIELDSGGLYKLRSDASFAAYLYGSDTNSAYGVPAAMGLKDLTRDDTLPPVPTWEYITYKSVIGTVTDAPSDEAGRSNLSIIYFNPDSSYNTKFGYTDFLPGLTSTTGWYLNIADTTQDACAVITFADRSGNDTTIAIEYSAFNISVDKQVLDLGYVKMGTVSEGGIVLRNPKNKGPIDITRAGFKYHGGQLSYEGLELPFTLQAGEARTITVKYSPASLGEFADSAGFGNNVKYQNKFRITAKVVEPSIAVEDIDFGEVQENETSTKDCMIKNNGKVDLVIAGIKVNPNPAFSNTLNTIDQNNPIIIKAGQSFSFSVSFRPPTAGLYRDSIVFISDSDTLGDYTALLKGTGTELSFLTSSYDWGRVRIDRPSDRRGPYPNNWVPGQKQAIWFLNNCSDTIVISSIHVNTTKGDINSFIIRYGDFPQTLNAGDSTLVDVKFQPTTVGVHEIKITYKGNVIPSPVTTLRGTGVLPRIRMDSKDFGYSDVHDPSTRQTKRIKIYNDYYDWADTLFITGFTYDPEGAVSETAGEYGTEGFSFDKEGLFSGAGRLVVPIGDSVEFDAVFLAQHSNTHRATLTTVSDADTEAVSVWTGNLATTAGDGNQQNPGLVVIPNPAPGGKAALRIASAEDCTATIKLYNSLGNEISTIYNGTLQQGINIFNIDVSFLPSGVYFLCVNRGDRAERLQFTNIR